jgi:hypothetical protein
MSLSTSALVSTLKEQRVTQQATQMHTVSQDQELEVVPKRWQQQCSQRHPPTPWGSLPIRATIQNAKQGLHFYEQRTSLSKGGDTNTQIHTPL